MTPKRAIWICNKAKVSEEHLSDWERKFVDSIFRQSERPNWSPSDKQVVVLEKIERKI